MWFNNKRKSVRCIDCIYCDAEKMMCYPDTKDCHEEYELDDDDLHIPAHCDFFKEKN